MTFVCPPPTPDDAPPPTPGGTVSIAQYVIAEPICSTANGVINVVKVLSTTGAIIDQLAYLPDGTQILPFPTDWVPCDSGAVVNTLQGEILCDVAAGDFPVRTRFIRIFEIDPSGAVVGTQNFTLTGAPYVPTGTVEDCEVNQSQVQVLCDDVGPFLRTYTYDDQGRTTGFDDTDLALAPYAPVGTIGACTSAAGNNAVMVPLCDIETGANDPLPFLRHYVFVPSSGVVTAVIDTLIDGTTPYVTTGKVGQCANALDWEGFILCDDQGGGLVNTFIRRFVYSDNNELTGTGSGIEDMTLTGAPYTPLGTVGLCSASTGGGTDDVEVVTLCDYDAGTGAITPFLRRWRFDTSTGAVLTTITTLLDGTTAFVPGADVRDCGTTSGWVLASGSVRLIGPNTFVVPATAAKLRSVTVYALAGDVQVTTSIGGPTLIPAGTTASWGADHNDDTVAPITFDVLTGADEMLLVWTEAP